MKKLFLVLISLTFLIPQFVFAQSNYNTSFKVTFRKSDFIFEDMTFGSTSYNYKGAFDYIINTETSNYFILMMNYKNANSTPTRITAMVTDSYPLVNNTPYFYLFNSNSRFYYFYNTNIVSYKYKQFSSTSFDQSMLDEIKSCISNFSTCSWSSINGLEAYFRPDNHLTVTNDSDFPIYIAPDNSQTVQNIPIYSNFRLTLGSPDSASVNENANYYKTLYVNDIEIKEGMSVPTYYDLYYPPEPEPDEPIPDEPVDPDEPTSDFTSWIYWFSEPTDSTSILNNIYTLLFLYCFTIIILKLYTIVKVKK